MTTADYGSEENTLKMEHVMPVGSILTRMEKSFRDSGGEGGIRIGCIPVFFSLKAPCLLESDFSCQFYCQNRPLTLQLSPQSQEYGTVVQVRTTCENYRVAG